jgi:hypothetical protein
MVVAVTLATSATSACVSHGPTRAMLTPAGCPHPGDGASWPTNYRTVLRFVLDEVEDRIAPLWSE